MTTTSSTTAAGLGDADTQLKQKHRAMWASGHYDTVAREVIPVLGERLVASLAPTTRPSPPRARVPTSSPRTSPPSSSTSAAPSTPTPASTGRSPTRRRCRGPTRRTTS